MKTLPVPVHVLRTGHRSGLIRARLQGAAQVKGQVILFLDAHVEATEGWLEPLLARVAEDRFVMKHNILKCIFFLRIILTPAKLDNFNVFFCLILDELF